MLQSGKHSADVYEAISRKWILRNLLNCSQEKAASGNITFRLRLDVDAQETGFCDLEGARLNEQMRGLPTCFRILEGNLRPHFGYGVALWGVARPVNADRLESG